MDITLYDIDIITFNRILKTGNFSLYKGGGLAKDWDRLLNEYELNSATKKEKSRLEKQKLMHEYVSEYDLVSSYCNSLDFKYDEDIVQELKTLGYEVSKENYLNDLDTVKRNIKSLLIKSKKLESELSNQTVKVEPQEEVSINQIVIAYCSFVGVSLKPSDISVMDFLGIKTIYELKLKELTKDAK